jgi:hypothetical protein
MTRKILATSLFGAITILSACSTTPLTTSMQPQAMETALTRARFDMQCPAATGQVLSSQNIQPLVEPGPWMRAGGIERAEFTVGVTGCGKQTTVVVICSQENGCFAGQPGN